MVFPQDYDGSEKLLSPGDAVAIITSQHNALLCFCGNGYVVFIKSTTVYSNVLGLHIHSLLTH